MQFAPKLASAGGNFDPDDWAQLFLDAGAAAFCFSVATAPSSPVSAVASSTVTRSTGINGSSRRMMRVRRGSRLGTLSASGPARRIYCQVPGAMLVIWSSPCS